MGKLTNKLTAMALNVSEIERILGPDAELASHGFSVWLWAEGAKEKLAKIIQEFKPYATIHKNYTEEIFTTIIRYPQFEIRIYTARHNVCRQELTGNMVETEIIDYENAPRTTKLMPETKWVCDPILDV